MRVLTALAGLAVLLSGCLWAAELLDGRRDAIALLGASAGVAGIVLVLLLLWAQRRQRIGTEKARQAELDRLEAEHRQELRSVNAQNRKALESFRSTMSHSLRMPVSIIQGYAELLAGDMVTNPDARREYLEKIVQRTRYMTDIMSRHFQEGEVMDKSQLSCSEVDLLSLIRQTSADIEASATEQMISVRVLSAEEQLVIRADAYLLNRALFNLLENALKYMGRPGTITIRLQKAADHAAVTVRDDGLGLSEKETEHIFERSFQGSNHVAQGGSGYGLHLVKQTVEAHGGTVSAKSGIGRGMSITMTLPL